MTDINDAPEIEPPLAATVAPKRRGRPPNRAATREPPRQAQEQYPLRDDGRTQVIGRDGEVLTRKRPTNSDQFHIPEDKIPAGYELQWNVVDVLGQPQVHTQLSMRENGWRPVPADRHPEMFIPGGMSGNEIIRDGLRLEERPIELNDEARQEEYMKADRLMRDQQEQLKLTSKMPDGFSRDNPNLRRMERSGTSRAFAPAPDAPRPRLPIEG